MSEMKEGLFQARASQECIYRLSNYYTYAALQLCNFVFAPEDTSSLKEEKANRKKIWENAFCIVI